MNTEKFTREKLIQKICGFFAFTQKHTGLCVLCAAVSLTAAVALSVSGFESGCENVRDNVLRLHVIANSDSQADQSLKLKVRDAVLKSGADIFGTGDSAAQAAQYIDENKDALQQAAQQTISDNGYSYSVSVNVCEDYFLTRTYGDVTLPAGMYTAVKVVIGEGNGHNWWCVMFPPLCLPAAENKTVIDDVLDADGKKIVEASPKYEYRFKIVEWIESIKAKVKN